MERDQIIRDDFPTSRRGWDPDAVRAHLESLAASLPTRDVSLADAAASRVGTILSAAEATAAQIETDARNEAETILAEAQAEAESILDRARTDARGRVEQAQGAVESLVAQAEDLRSRVGSLGESLAVEVSSRVGAEQVVPGPELMPEPELEPEPKPEADDFEEEPQSAAPEAEGEAPLEGGSTEDLIAQLRGGTKDIDVPESQPTAPDATVDRASVRLVALNMALEGSGRDAIARQIVDEFGEVPDLEEILDDVLERTAG